jgi:hypothetical protein
LIPARKFDGAEYPLISAEGGSVGAFASTTSVSAKNIAAAPVDGTVTELKSIPNGTPSQTVSDAGATAIRGFGSTLTRVDDGVPIQPLPPAALFARGVTAYVTSTGLLDEFERICSINVPKFKFDPGEIPETAPGTAEVAVKLNVTFPAEGVDSEVKVIAVSSLLQMSGFVLLPIKLLTRICGSTVTVIVSVGPGQPIPSSAPGSVYAVTE